MQRTSTVRRGGSGFRVREGSGRIGRLGTERRGSFQRVGEAQGEREEGREGGRDGWNDVGSDGDKEVFVYIS
jgi:hypothetical protein